MVSFYRDAAVGRQHGPSGRRSERSHPMVSFSRDLSAERLQSGIEMVASTWGQPCGAPKVCLHRPLSVVSGLW